ncbi:MAG TPA: cache domain-containing protein, partial [Geobacteraceae bacterium]
MARRFPIRAKLTVGALVPLFVAIGICSLAGLYIINAKIASQAQEKVRTDLNSAREAYRNELSRIDELVGLAAANPFAAEAIASSNRAALASLLTSLRHRKQLDILVAVDGSGRVLYRAHNPPRFGDRPANAPFISEALGGKAVAGTTVFTREQLAAEEAHLAARATIEVVPTPHSRPRQGTVETSGMVMVASAPVRDAAGRVVGALYGGELLNNSNLLVDRIKDTVYEGVKFNGQDVGTATLFLGDTRIATNVPAEGGR